MRHRIAYLVSHPIQYQAPLLRFLSGQPDIDLTVFFESGHSLASFADEGFGRQIQWDVPLLEGYCSAFLPKGNPTPLVRRLWRGEFDALWVHGYADWRHWLAMAAARVSGVPVLIRDEATGSSRRRSPFKTAAKRHLFFPALSAIAGAFLAIGAANRQYYLDNGIDAERIFLAPYCVDNDFFRALAAPAAERRPLLRAELGLELGRPVILYASKFQPRKRPQDVLAAFGKLIARGGASARPYLLFVGDGEMRSALEDEARPLGGDVRFLGFRNQSELPALFDLCDVFVLPSEREPWGLVVNEAMSVGRPVIVSDDVGCGPDLVRDGVNGFIFPVGDTDALAAALAQVTRDPGRAIAMGRAGSERIDQWGFDQVLEGLRAALAALPDRMQAGG